MKKLNVLTRMLLLVALLVGSTSVWGETVTFTAGTDKGNAGEPCSVTKDGITISFSNGTFSRDDNYRCYSGASMTVSSTVGNMTSIAFVATAGNPMTKFSGNPDVGSWTKTDDTHWTWNGNASSINFGGTSGQCRITSVVVTYTSATKEDPTITFSNGSVRVGKTLDLSTLFNSNSSGAVTYSITSGDTYASVSENILTGNAAGSVTVQASQAAAGKYNAKTATATITVNPALVLSSIAVTKSPTKTTYTEGETFDPTGMVVTATYADNSTDDVTALCSYTPSSALTTSDTEITISYTENAVEKTTTQSITVLPYVQPKIIDATFNNEFLGVEAGTRITEKTTITQDNVDFVFDKISGSNWPQGDANIIRIYKGTTLQIKAPTGYVLTNITFTNNGDWKDGMEADKGTYDDDLDGDNKTYWTGLYAACNDGAGNIYGTYSNSKSFVVPADLTVSAVGISEGKLVVTDYNTGDVVKANTGVMVKAKSSVDVNKTILLSDETGKEISGNLLKASSVAMTGENLFYRLTMHNGDQIGFYWGAENGGAFALAANKAYLAVPVGSAGSAKEGFSFISDEEETDGIKAVSTKVENGVRYNLAGQKVGADYKGIVIVNGKKYLNK